MDFPGHNYWRWAAGLMTSLCAAMLAVMLSGAPQAGAVMARSLEPAGMGTAPRVIRPSTAYTMNVPLVAADADDTAYDANNWSVVWFGKVSRDHNNYGELRLLGRVDGVEVRIQLYDQLVTADDIVTLELNGRNWRVPYTGAESWEIGERCEDGGCRGWSVDGLIPWNDLGGRPREGSVWPLRVTFVDGDSQVATDSAAVPAPSRSTWPPRGMGSLRWGLPDYAGRSDTHVQAVEVKLTADSMLGGGTDCAEQDWPDYFPTWGNRNFGESIHANVQMQWDVADWPCYAKYYAAWSLADLPVGAQVISATVEMRQFGNPGFERGYGDSGTKDTVVQVFEVNRVWEETRITWDSAPVPSENTARTLVRPLPGDCEPTPYWFCSPGIAYTFDVTEIVKRAQGARRNWASLALYTAAGQYHSGKYFWSREGSEPPIVRMAYAVELVAPGARMWPVAHSAAVPLEQRILNPLGGRTYYISPSGSDGNSGTSTGSAWATFARAWQTLQPGDTLLLDGTYTASTTGVIQPNVRNGEPGKPITIKALNDGKAVVDGQGEQIPVRLGENWGPQGAIGNWFVVEGIVARNGTISNFRIEHGNNNVLRRISAYDADADDNSNAIGVIWSDNNLVEDCVAAGTGRYMINIFTSDHTTVRRCFTMWQRWDGRAFCGVSWPNGNNVGVYNSSNTTVENVIAYGRALTGIFIQANSDTAIANNNQILGSMALLQGRDYDSNLWRFGSPTWPVVTRPGPTADFFGGNTCDASITEWWWPNQRVGFMLWGQGELRDNLFRDILATGNAGLGWGSGWVDGPGPNNLTIDHATMYGNGAELASSETGQGGNIHIVRGDDLLSHGNVRITNSQIANSQWADQGEGAHFHYRYVGRKLTDQLLWPWSMEERIVNETGVSINEIGIKYANAEGVILTVAPTVVELERNGSAEVTVKVDVFGNTAKPVSLNVSGNGSGLTFAPAAATVNAVAQWTFKVTAPDVRGIHELTITGNAEGILGAERKLIILVDPQKLFLPAVSSGRR